MRVREYTHQNKKCLIRLLNWWRANHRARQIAEQSRRVHDQGSTNSARDGIYNTVRPRYAIVVVQNVVEHFNLAQLRHVRLSGSTAADNAVLVGVDVVDRKLLVC